MLRVGRNLLFAFLFFASVFAAAHSEEELKEKLCAEGIRFTDNNSIVFFDNGQAKFDDLFAAVRQAHSSIHMEYFNFRNDSIANMLFSLLGQKAAEGVEVRLLYDAFGNASNNRPIKKDLLRKIRATGVRIYEFDPIRFPWVNHIIPRDHRKIVVIDGKSAYSGGMNVADYYIKGKAEIGGWHDIHYRVEGAAVGEYQKIFLRMWKRVTGEDVHGAKYYPGESYPWNQLTGLKKDTTSTASHKVMGVVNREPHTSPKVIRRTFVEVIDASQRLLQIINPYFTLNGPIHRALKRAVRRGVRVEIMVSEKSDIAITPRIVDYRVRQLQKEGAHIYYYRGGFHHSKIMMVDSAFCYAGSANLDSRSLRCDYEVNAVILDPASTHELQHVFNRDKTTKCVPLTDEYWHSRSRWQRFMGWIYHFLIPFV
jgi:cardiolipin synthase